MAERITSAVLARVRARYLKLDFRSPKLVWSLTHDYSDACYNRPPICTFQDSVVDA